MRSKLKKLEPGEEVEVQKVTEDDAAEEHAIFFNREMAGSQAYGDPDRRLAEHTLPAARRRGGTSESTTAGCVGPDPPSSRRS